MSNYEPVIKGGDHGIWRRVKKMPWDYQIKPEEKDPDFAEKFLSFVIHEVVRQHETVRRHHQS